MSNGCSSCDEPAKDVERAWPSLGVVRATRKLVCMGSVAAEARLCVVSAEQLSAGRSAGYAEHGPALSSRSGLTRKYPKNASLFWAKKPPKKRPAKTLVFFGFPCY